MKETIFNPEGLEPLAQEELQATGLFRHAGKVFITANVFYFLVVSIVAMPMVLQQLWLAVQAGSTPALYLVEVSLAALVPVIVCGVVYKYKIYSDARALMRLFVATEVPVASLLVLRSMWFHELTAAAEILYAMVFLVAVGNAVLVIQSLRSKDALNGQSELSLSGSALSALIAVGGVYISLIGVMLLAPVTIGVLVGGIALACFSVPALVVFPLAILGIPIGGILAVTGAGGLVIALYAPWCYCDQWLSRMRSVRQSAHLWVSAIAMAVFITGFVVVSLQPQKSVLNMLDVNQTLEPVQTGLLERDEEIRSGLVNAYLGALRYVPVSIGWSQFSEVFKPTDWALGVLLKPVMYHGNPAHDRRRAEAEYEAFFDAPIQRAERASILSALSRHWRPVNSNGAGLLDTGIQRIHVESQQIDVQVQQGVATITVQEALLNKTSRRLESLMYFTLPVDAVVTGLWLSDTQTDLEKYAFQVAPRGAAQQVYQEEVARSVDPALLEKVGPQQYRLRVFPVLPNSAMHVKLKYKAVPNEKNQWPLPVLLEQRNVFWNKDTKRTINGKKIKPLQSDGWIPAGVAQTDIPKSSLLSYNDGTNVITAVNLQEYPLSVENKNIAVIIDGSYSMQAQRAAVVKALKKLTNAELFFCKTNCVSTSVKSKNDWVFFGKAQPLEQLASFASDFNLQKYDAVLLLSDGGTYEFGESQVSLSLTVPTWLAQLGEGAHAYNDTLLDTLRSSGGGVAGSVEQALVELTVVSQGEGVNVMPLGVSDGRLWLQQAANSDHAHNPQLAEIVAALKIEGVSRGQRSLHPAMLDNLHAMAVEQGVVSRFSSMIVLVDERQRRRLEELSNKKDRFDREVETGKQMVRTVPAVPEPHEWALLLLGMMMLSMVTYKRARDEQWTIDMAKQRVAERFPWLGFRQSGWLA